MTGVLTAAAPLPNTTFTLVSGLPSTMNVGETYTVVVQVDSDVPFSSVHANPSFQFPGKGVVAVQGGDRAGSGTSATLEITYKAKIRYIQNAGWVCPGLFCGGCEIWRRVCGSAGICVQCDRAVDPSAWKYADETETARPCERGGLFLCLLWSQGASRDVSGLSDRQRAADSISNVMRRGRRLSRQGSRSRARS